MANFFKTNRKVAEYLNLQDARNRAKDGNYLLWECDMKRIGPEEYSLRATGAVKLTPAEARMEFVGERCIPLNTPIDPRFTEETESTSAGNAENPNGGNVSEEVEQGGAEESAPVNKEEE